MAFNHPFKPPSNFNCPTIEQCNAFLNYFTNKIENIYNAIACHVELVEMHSPNLSDLAFSSFSEVDFDFIPKIVLLILGRVLKNSSLSNSTKHRAQSSLMENNSQCHTHHARTQGQHTLPLKIQSRTQVYHNLGWHASTDCLLFLFSH